MTKTKQIFITTLSLMFCVMLAFMFSACKISLGGGGNGNSNGGGVVTPTIEKRILYLGADSISSKLSEGQTSLNDQISDLQTRIDNETNDNTKTQLQSQKAELEAGYSVIANIQSDHFFVATKTSSTDENGNDVYVYDAKTSEILSPFLNNVIPYSSTSPIYFQYGDDSLNQIAKWQISNENNYACIRCYKKYTSAGADTNYEFWIIKFYYNESTKKITNFEYSYIDSRTTSITVDQVNYNGTSWSASTTTTDDGKIENMYNQATSFASSLNPAKVTHTRTYDGTNYTYTKIEPGSSE